jgi:phospholipid/cholesterol/gamma-HCH transport system substrate-binding protein
MKKPGLEIKVGLLVASGIILFMITILMLGGDSALFESRYKLNISFNAVTGLGQGSIVRVLGLKVGSISDIIIDENTGKVRVEMSIAKKVQHLITKGSMGELRTQGALGDKYIFITPGSSEAEPVPEDGWIETNPDEDLFTTLAKKGSEFNKVFEVIDNTNVLIKGLNAEGKSKEMVENLADASQQLKSLLVKLDAMAGKPKENGDIQTAVYRLNSILAKIDNGQGTLGKLVNDPSLHSRLKEMLGGSKRTKYMKGLIRESIKAGKKEK